MLYKNENSSKFDFLGKIPVKQIEAKKIITFGLDKQKKIIIVREKKKRNLLIFK